MEKNKDKNTNKQGINSGQFKQPFLSTFFLDYESLPFKEDFLHRADEALSGYEKREIDWELEKALRLRNDLLVSFAVSKAENSSVTLAEAEEVYKIITADSAEKNFPFLSRKLKKGEKLTKKDHDRLEYFNIARTFKNLSDQKIELKDLSLKFILDLHNDLTVGLDIFDGRLEGFEPYHSGKLRGDDETRVADYRPAPHEEIEESVKELIDWLKNNPSAINISVFQAALYAVHPFKNGNKRVCRVLEHIFLRSLGYNSHNLYSPSRYYYKHQDRYYKRLVETLYKHNLNYFASFASEALIFSVLGVIAGVLQRKKAEFLERSGLSKEVAKIMKPLVKRREVKFSRFYALAKRKAARQTFVNYLEEAVGSGVVKRREQGKNVYYSLAGEYAEEKILEEWLRQAREKLNFLPEELESYV